MSVSHNRLMLKLAALGIDGNLSWIKNFLANGSHQTRVGTSLSDILQLISGVIQGIVNFSNEIPQVLGAMLISCTKHSVETIQLQRFSATA